jgi:hypothetical protein
MKHGGGFIKYDGAWGPTFDGIWDHDNQSGVGIQLLYEQKNGFSWFEYIRTQRHHFTHHI